MKRLSIMFMAALVVLAMSCKKNGNDDLEQGPGFRASLEKQSDNGKTHLENGTDVKWDANDAILVVNAVGNPKQFTTDGVITEGYADFQSDATESFYKSPYKAYYPSSLYDATTGMVTLPPTQTYMAGSFAPTMNPMAAKAMDNTLEFKNICGMLALQLKGDNITVSSIRITSKGGENLWGSGELTMEGTDNSMEPTLGTLSGGSNVLSLNCNNAVTLNTATASTFYFVLPHNSLSGGFDVFLTDSNGKVWKRSASTNTEIHRNKIRMMPEQSVVVDDPIVPDMALTIGCVDCIYTVGGTATFQPEQGSQHCEFGLVFSDVNTVPTIDDTRIPAHYLTDPTISGSNPFTVELGALTTGVTYYVRAYGICDDVVYSDEVETVVGGDGPQPLPSDWINGKNPHRFKVNASGQVVYFSQANLQYRAQGGIGGNATQTAESGQSVGETWRFAEHQFDIVGYSNSYMAWNYDGWIDLFGWATSGYNHGATCYQLWSTSQANGDYCAYGNSSRDLYYQTPAIADWGYNTIYVGTTPTSGWRSLTAAEWTYVAYTRTIKVGTLTKNAYGEGRVGCTPGYMLLPDDWNWNKPGLVGLEAKWKKYGKSAYANEYSYPEWAKMEAWGAVFLPAAGYRNGTDSHTVNNGGDYSSSNPSGGDNAREFHFAEDEIEQSGTGKRMHGHSIRLVSDTPPTPTR